MRRTNLHVIVAAFAALLAAAAAGCSAPPTDLGAASTPPAAPGAAAGHAAVLRTYRFTHDPGISIDVLSREAFEWRFGDNPNIPRSDAAVLARAKNLFAPGQAALAGGGCGESVEGAVLAALSNPRISDATRRQVDMMLAAAVPPLPQTFVDGHFKFLYTTTDPNPKNNVSLEGIKATAKMLNAHWDDYVKNFDTPKHYIEYGKKMIDVRVYYISGIYGSTSSFNNYIRLNSATVVESPCKRQTTTAHELFHRVQYVHGYVTGMNENWAVEGTAAWSQKHRAPHVGDWIVRIKSGLKLPDKDLFARKYDAVHFWIHLSRWTGAELPTLSRMWELYKAHAPYTRKPSVAALTALIREQVGRNHDRRWLAETWAAANLLKSAPNAAVTQTYDEQHQTWRCGLSKYGPLPPVKIVKELQVKPGSTHDESDNVGVYGADYYMLFVDPALAGLDVTLASKSSADRFAFSVIELDAAGNIKSVSRSGLDQTSYSYQGSYAAAKPARVAVMVVGLGEPGDYTMNVKGK